MVPCRSLGECVHVAADRCSCVHLETFSKQTSANPGCCCLYIISVLKSIQIYIICINSTGQNRIFSLFSDDWEDTLFLVSFFICKTSNEEYTYPESTYATLKRSVLAHNSPTLHTCAKAVLGQCVGDY